MSLLLVYVLLAAVPQTCSSIEKVSSDTSACKAVNQTGKSHNEIQQQICVKRNMENSINLYVRVHGFLMLPLEFYIDWQLLYTDVLLEYHFHQSVRAQPAALPNV